MEVNLSIGRFKIMSQKGKKQNKYTKMIINHTHGVTNIIRGWNRGLQLTKNSRRINKNYLT